MKIILSSRRRHYVASVSIFLVVVVVVALIAGMVGCVGDGGPYTLDITSTAGGSIIAPGEGIFTYDAGTVDELFAEPDEDYYFSHWLLWDGVLNIPVEDIIADVYDATIPIHILCDLHIIGVFFRSHPMVAAGLEHTVGLKDDGTVVAVGANSSGQCNVGNWTGIAQVAAGGFVGLLGHTVGLPRLLPGGGTVVAVGETMWGQCNVDTWMGIVQVAAAGFYTVGVCSDGTVASVGNCYQGSPCVTSGWTSIVQVAAGGTHTVGLKPSITGGIVVADGYNSDGQLNVNTWTNIVQVAAGGLKRGHTVGLESGGTVVATGYNTSGQCNVDGWADITQVAAGGFHTVGLKSNGTVVAVGSNSSGQCNVSDWTDIVQVAAGGWHTVGLKSDGTVVAVGANYTGECNVDGWDLTP